MNASEIVDCLHAAKLVQADLKAKLLEIDHEHDIAKSKLYLEFVENGDAHFKALNSCNAHKTVINMRKQRDAAEMDLLRASVTVSHHVNQLRIIGFAADTVNIHVPVAQ